jgi:hypothetical protein
MSLRWQVRNCSVRFDLLIFFLVFDFIHYLIGILYFHTLMIFARVVVRSWLALNLVLNVNVLILHLSINWLFRDHKISLIGSRLD